MKVFSRQLIIWIVGLLMPVWLLLAGNAYKLIAGAELSGRWLYVSIIAGAVLCAGSVLTSELPIVRRVVFVFASWLMLAVEVLLLGVFEFSRSGLTGIQ
jgi:hypothetical protein